jgi:hypothetical protein
MNLCSDDHEEVCYEGRTCPVCELKKERDDEVDKLNNSIEDLKSSNEFLESELASAKEGLLLLKGEET